MSMPLKTIFTLLIIVFTSTFASAAEVNLSWQPNPEPDVSHYNIYYGSASRDYEPSIPVGNTTHYTVNNLVEGNTYHFSVTAVDTSGNESGFSSEASLTVKYMPADTTAPTVSITSPTSAESFASDSAVLDIAGTSVEDGQLQDISWTSSSGASGVADGNADWSIQGVQLAEGQNVITITATDAAGNTGSATLRVEYTPADTTPPVVDITSPSVAGEYTAASSTIEVSGKASDETALAHISWFSSAGQSGEVSGTTDWSISGIDLAEGSTTITVTATDSSGNSATDTLTVTYQSVDMTAPMVQITSPTMKKHYFSRTSTVAIGGNASDDNGIAKVIWQNSRGERGVCSGTESWQATEIKIDRWWSTISVTAVDHAGNTAEHSLRVFRWR